MTRRVPVPALNLKQRGGSVAYGIIRTAKHLTITDAHLHHRYVSDDRPRGNAIAWGS